MQINHNMAALNAWRNLGVSTSTLGTSLEKLSSGFRINRAGDDPAGLLISEQLRAQIGGLDQATRNANDAISMVQTAEGALTEMNTMLNSIRSLAIHAANTGANDANAILADQTAVDKAIDSIQRIAVTTKFAGKALLDGTAGTVITDSAGTATDSVVVGTVATSGAITISVTTVASQALVSCAFSGATVGSTGTITIWLEEAGVASGTINYAVASGMTLSALLVEVNGNTATTGIRASMGAGAGDVSFISTRYGSAVKVVAVVASALTAAGDGLIASDAGANVVASIGGVALDGSGLVLYGSSTSVWANTTFNLTATTATTLAGYAFSIAIGDLQFALTDDAATANLVTYGIGNMQTDKIGITTAYANAGLNDIRSGQTYALANQPAVAVAIIDQAIADVSMQRATLGAFQKYTLESTLNNLGVTRENLAASESRIRDVDMAQEMMTFTKNQILVQAGTAMLAQANQLPQTVLQLLK